MATLEAHEIVTGYGRTEIVHGISMEVDSGEVLCIIGPNGAGKSTFIKALAGALPVKSGTLRFQDIDITHRNQEVRARQGIGYVPQSNDVFPSLTTGENLAMGAYLCKKHEVKIRQAAALERFPQLKKVLTSRASSLSGGERKLLGIARVLMAEPKVLLLDEPSAGLSPQYADIVRGHIRNLAKDGHTVVIVEQHAIEALEISDRAMVLVAGRKHSEGLATDFLESEDLGQMFLGRR
ncbi:MAG TPA: ABC transporter ATP-binding protein [Acidimicrobiales bacterium]|nr:ABC transporter ATP-binding protein [Acidimicrobiales bacterium]